MAACADREVSRRSSGVDAMLAGLPGLLLTGVEGLALRLPPPVDVTTAGTVQEHTLLVTGGPNCVAADTAVGCCLSHSCNL